VPGGRDSEGRGGGGTGNQVSRIGEDRPYTPSPPPALLLQPALALSLTHLPTPLHPLSLIPPLRAGMLGQSEVPSAVAVVAAAAALRAWQRREAVCAARWKCAA
jgi:hypothetical protein